MYNILVKDSIVPYVYKGSPYFSNGFQKDTENLTFTGSPTEVKCCKSFATKVYTIKCGVGIPLTCSELATVIAFTHEGKFEKKLVRDLTTEDFVLQPYGYFSDFFTEDYLEGLQHKIHYILGLWYGRGERFHNSKPCVRFDKTKDYDICKLLNDSEFVDSKEDNADFTTYYLKKEICKASDLLFSRYYSMQNAYHFTRGVIDGSGYIYHGENHHSDLGIKFQSKSRFVAKVIQMLFQSLGVMSYCSDDYLSDLFNAKLHNFDLRIRGNESIGNFCKFFGFTNSFKNQLVLDYFNSMENNDYIPKGVGSYIAGEHPEPEESYGNYDESVKTFLTGETNGTRAILHSLELDGDPYIEYLCKKGILSSIKDIEVQTGYFTGFGAIIKDSVMLNSIFIS